MKVFKEKWGVDVWFKFGYNNDGDEFIVVYKIILVCEYFKFLFLFKCMFNGFLMIL